MKKTTPKTRAEKREQKNRRRMSMSGGSLRKASKHAGMAIIKKK